MARETRCMTPGAIFSTRIEPTSLEVKVSLPTSLDLNEDEAAHLERTLHNAVELALAPLFVEVAA